MPGTHGQKHTTAHEEAHAARELTPAEPHAAEPHPVESRDVPLELSPEQFRSLGYRLVDQIAGWLASVPELPVAPATSPTALRTLLDAGDRAALPNQGSDAAALLDEAAALLFEHSTFNGHPRFFGYITSSAAPLGSLADLLAAAVNPNVGAWSLSPIATEIERQTVRWIAELLGYPVTCGGLLVSGGNMANLVCCVAATRARARWDVRTSGLAGGPPLVLYASAETHKWVQTAADILGFGSNAIRWVPVDSAFRMNVAALRQMIASDRADGYTPFLVVGTAGTVSTGAIDPLRELAAVCREHGLWFHVDGAYGAPAVLLPDASPDLQALGEADSVAFDPHKWLYAPLEAGCALVSDGEALRRAFSFRPPYYRFDGDPQDPPTNYFEWGPQNSRGFRALKVWLGLRQAGRDGYARMIAEDIALARTLHERAAAHPELEALTLGLSIATFRYVPTDLRARLGAPDAEAYLSELNATLLTELQHGGEVYLSNAILNGHFALRACVVNFRTTVADVEAVPAIVAKAGRTLDARLRPPALR